MNILFLTLLDFESLDERNIYTDLLREYVKHGHKVFVISPVERRKRSKTQIFQMKNTQILKLNIGNITQTNVIEKGISTLSIESIFICGIKKYFKDVKFDVVVYSTPPITFYNAIEYIKKRDGAKTYLLLKDIFPQNAVDIGILSTSGVKGIIYKFFRNKEKKLYMISDHIGCMSQANVDYIIKHNPEVDSRNVNVCPNSIEIVDKSVSAKERNRVRNKYDMPIDKKVFVYGGNLGKPQGIEFLIQCLKSQHNNEKVYFLIVGDGTEYGKLEQYIKNDKPDNVKLMKKLPREDFESIVGACDVGMIFLDHRFTIPNFPSRLLSYMQAQIPVFAVTDQNTDIGKVITEGGFGWWCPSDDVDRFDETIRNILKEDLNDYSEKAMKCLKELYSVQKSYEIMIKHF